MRVMLGVARERHLAGQALDTARSRASRRRHGRRPALHGCARVRRSRRADQLLALGQPLLAADVLREPEVDQVGMHAAALGAIERVGWLDVPVDQAAGMRRVERVGELPGDRHRPLRRERALAAQQPRRGRTRDVAHRDVQHAVDLARLVDRHDARCSIAAASRDSCRNRSRKRSSAAS